MAGMEGRIASLRREDEPFLIGLHCEFATRSDPRGGLEDDSHEGVGDPLPGGRNPKLSELALRGITRYALHSADEHRRGGPDPVGHVGANRGGIGWARAARAQRCGAR
jgi:hypothetical protein